MNDKAIVTLLIGDSMRRFWSAFMEKSWRLYAEKQGYDIVLIDDYIDREPLARERTPHWQKLLVLQHPEVRKYRHAVWVDADICINHFTAPSIVDGMTTDKVGCVVFEKGESARRLYRNYGIEDGPDQLTNTGVLVMQPAKHAEMCEWIYRNYKENNDSAKENIPLSYHLFAHDLAEPIDPRFNVDWTDRMFEHYPFLENLSNQDRDLLAGYCVHVAWARSHFLHFINQIMTIEGLPETYNTRMDIRFLFQDKLVPRELIVRRTS